MSGIIREAAAEDAEAMIEYLKAIGGESDSLTFGAEGLPLTAESERAFLNSVLADERSTELLAVMDGMLMEELIAFAEKSGTEIVNLDVRSDNTAAIHLYEKFGFRRFGRSPAYFKIDGEYIDFDLMYLDLRKP